MASTQVNPIETMASLIRALFQISEIKFVEDNILQCPTGTIFVNFYIPALRAAIVLDDAGVFDPKLDHEYDLFKDQWCRDTGTVLLRLSYEDVGDCIRIMERFVLDLLHSDKKTENELVMCSGFKGYDGRGYVVVGS